MSEAPAVPVLPHPPPATCQRGHPLVWLLGPESVYAEGVGLAACDCSLRLENGRQHNGSVPTLWCWVPRRPRELRPFFVGQGRTTFALALRLRTVLLGTAAPLSPAPRDIPAQRAYLKRLQAEAAPHIKQIEYRLNPLTGSHPRAKAQGTEGPDAPEVDEVEADEAAEAAG
jgi:hypothetical protein